MNAATFIDVLLEAVPRRAKQLAAITVVLTFLFVPGVAVRAYTWYVHERTMEITHELKPLFTPPESAAGRTEVRP